MVNPFEKRATEYLRDDEAFLAFISPEPLLTFFEKPSKQDILYDRLTVLIGTPGSGKTTLARLFQFSILQTLLRNPAHDDYSSLIDALTTCGAIKDGKPTLLAARIPLESEYREFWEFPYPDELKIRLMITLLQARAVLSWLRNLSKANIDLDKVQIIPRADAEASLASIGGKDGPALLERAREVESAIYKISAALVPPDINEIDAVVKEAYRPFDVIEAFSVSEGDNFIKLCPLVIFDDAHSLHPSQLTALRRWLARRELKVARWILMRLDALTPADVLIEESPDVEESGIKKTREITTIRLQSTTERAQQRRAFRKMAKDMANRYLQQMDIFSRRRLINLEDILAIHPEAIAPSKRHELATHVNALQNKYKITAKRRITLEAQVAEYLKNSGELSEELSLAMLAILFERYYKRIPQKGLFDEHEIDLEPNKPLTADSGVAEGARIHLLHKYGRPYYYGMETLCDAGSENAEQFLQLASRLVSQSETQLIRAKSPTLDSALQHNLLREKASAIIKDWDFPQHQLVRRLANGIAEQCIEKSLERNAPLASGANAFGILQEEFELIPSQYPDLAKVLQFGVAYNAFSLIPNYGTKRKFWCLIELTGVLSVHYGLTLHKGGFLERNVTNLLDILSESKNV